MWPGALPRATSSHAVDVVVAERDRVLHRHLGAAVGEGLGLAGPDDAGVEMIHPRSVEAILPRATQEDYPWRPSRSPTWPTARKADYDLLDSYEEGYVASLPDRLLAALDDAEGLVHRYQVTRYEHSLQSATRAHTRRARARSTSSRRCCTTSATSWRRTRTAR